MNVNVTSSGILFGLTIVLLFGILHNLHVLVDQDIFSVLEECFSFINEFKGLQEATGSGGRILIHCYQGVSRASTICAAYMIQFLGYSVDDALECIRLCRPQASPNYNFMKSLRVLESHCVGEK
jgi:protein-tyrosine phosphatase